MWEAIEANRRRSRLVLGGMALLLIALGGAIGGGAAGEQGIPIGVGAAFIVWCVMWLTTVTAGESILLAGAGARKIEKEDAPQLWNVVEEMTIAAGLPNMPAVYLIDDDMPNAFAVGRKPERAAVAVTSGLLARLDRDELQGVIAHEIGHVHNLDIRFMTTAGVMMGSIVMISDMFLRSMRHAGRRGGGRSKSGGGGGGNPMLIVALVLAVLAPLFAQLMYFACSRRREYLADASAARFTRYPAGLASALDKIAGRIENAAPAQKANRVLAPMYIVNPLAARGGGGGWFSTHPKTEDRVRVLRSMEGGADYARYEAAYRRVHGEGEHCLGERSLAESQPVPEREATAEPPPRAAAVERARGVTDLLDRLGGMILIPCACGVRIKAPPGLGRETVPCPRCGRENAIPRAEAAGTAGGHAVSSQGPAQSPLVYRRTGAGWESFKCACGRAIQLSPRFEAPTARCQNCGREIRIVSG